MSSEILAQIDSQLSKFLSARAMFPHTKENLIGAKHCQTAPFYRQYGYNITFSFNEPLTAERIEEINEVGHWINQNYVVRLCALLESYGVISKTEPINKELDGHEEVDILRRLRNKFAHTAGWYNPTDPEVKQLRDRTIRHFALNEESHPESRGKFPIPIDRVLLPLTEGCKRYVQELSSCEG
jgi:hypothetical protein